MLRETEQFRFGRTDWDGRIGMDARVHGSGWSTTALEELGLCPLRFFFKRILEVDELENEISPLDIAAKDLGIAVHKLLELIYADLQKEGLFSGADPITLQKRGRELMDLHKNTAFHGIRRRRADHLQPLWRVQESIWLDAAGRFLDNDLETLAEMGPVSLELEQYVAAPVDLGDEVTLQVGGKFDRSIRTGEALRLSDYKTSGKLDKRASKSEMLKGNQLQVPIYRLLAGGFPAVELLGVGPSYVEPGRDEARKVFTGFDRDDQQDGMLETLRVLAGLLHNGFYPLREDSKSCDYCAYKPGCRVNHPPTLERELSAPDCRDYGLLQAKNTYRGRTLLKDLQGREGSK
jgi:RecB family exonuclease